jgi:PAS domain S-box-containing protein
MPALMREIQGDAMRRPGLSTLDRLALRLTLGITLLVIGPMAVGLYFLARSHFDHTLEARRTAARLENRLLEAALRHGMIERDDRLMTGILEEVGQAPAVRAAMVLDHEGTVRHSSRRGDVGTRLSRDSPTCAVCHAKAPEAREHWVVLEGEEDVLRSVLPIANGPECHQCHDPRRAFNGILILDVSLAETRTHLRHDAAWMAGATFAMIVLLLVGIGLLIRQIVLVRLDRLSRAARAIAGGALDERVAVSGDDVLAALGSDFNNMADATSSLIETIKERERQMAGVLNSLDDGLIVLDRDFRVVAANQSISRRLSAYPETLKGRHCRDAVGHLLPCEQDETCPTARCLSTGELQRAIYRLPGSGGEGGRVHEVYVSPVYSRDGSVEQVVEVWRDITERVREEEHLAEIERLSALGVLASGLSHQVNTPLASMLTCAESILGRLDASGGAGVGAEDRGAIREGAATIREQALRCRRITDQFLRFARGIPPSIEPIDLQEVARRIFSLAEPTAVEAGIAMRLEEHAAVPPVDANTEVAQHVILNVVVNAIESCERAGGAIQARFVVAGDVRLQIRDTGCGIPAEFQKHLFEPFRTRKPRGTGLGLYLSRQFMRRFGGDVRLVDSVVGRGSCVEIVFPRSDRAAA